ncbi:Putative capsular polysaccharide transport protein [Salinisphaera shabanensis E1L3A]|uniref:Capsular polysaccharide transport protein n=1 Tax=Salinisphaera shabanensis E1L3A TaxID=1033802 RepID=U2FT16_9GAMM|nr:polysaccharide biosynthesis/export family protein [Salinisphaera shabanensis]ERJ17548.1 Putative capsular polysaccharide transport protein [Salinisphaera shabanensis E1L3A]
MANLGQGGAQRRARHGVPRCAIAGLLMSGLFGISGCALPGYSSDAMDSGSWYDFGGNDNAATYDEELSKQEIDYEPRVLQITPWLIRHQQEKAATQTLGEAQQRVSAAPSEVTNYTIGPGDVLQVIVFGHPELTNPAGVTNNEGIQGQLVSADGNIYYPYVGEVNVEGMTLKELRQRIAKGLSQYIREPQVDVRVREYRSQRIYISGDIAKPCTVPFTDVTITVLEALDQCDSLASKEGGGVGVQNVILIRDGESTPLDLNQIYSSGRPVPLRPGDRLLIDDSANRIFMVGEFSEQTALPYSTGGMSLSDAIADAGGVSLGSADTSAIYVIRGFVDSQPTRDGGVQTVLRPNVYKLDASNVSGLLLANQFKLQPRDVVFAAPANFVNFNRALALITPSLDLLFRSYLIYDRYDRRRD